MSDTTRAGSAAIYDVLAEREVMVPMRDGVRLATDLYFPALDGQRAPGRFPVLLERTPYNKHGLGGVKTAKFFARHGYVTAIQDVRGRFASEGEWYAFALEGPDGYDTVEWLGTQEWSDGKVGTIGLSYSGSDQHALATLHPPHLAAMFASEAMANYHTGSMRQGGAMELRFMIYAFIMAWDAPESLANPALQAAVKRELDNIHQWLGRTPLKPGVSVLRHFPAIERWVLDVLRHGDYDDYWKQHGYNVEEYYDDHADVPLYSPQRLVRLLHPRHDGQLHRPHRAQTRAGADDHRAVGAWDEDAGARPTPAMWISASTRRSTTTSTASASSMPH